ncbi:MAG: RNA polymerase subunit sigma-70 [Actinobacteria bacterium 13_2_20CM_2_66_6]|nr:MAG: RNA polymerase subunit sigma-70 [Actinobacteria bacterium 13_2_20CM_2_66_6]
MNSIKSIFSQPNDAGRLDWQELTHLTQGQPITVERVRLSATGIAIEGDFELPQLARLSVEDQVFVTAFVRSHGSIKEMESVFGVSYPTIKARLNRIAGSLEFVETNPLPSRAEILDRLSRGEIDTEDAIRQLERLA